MDRDFSPMNLGGKCHEHFASKLWRLRSTRLTDVETVKKLVDIVG
jgi:hypothetical protein